MGEVEFKEFALKELFKIRRGKRVVKSKQIEGEIPYVTAVSTNNGVDSYIKNPGFVDENILTANFFGDVFYHPYRLGYKDGTYGLKLRDKTKRKRRVYLYLTTVIEKVSKSKGSYSNGLILKDFEEMVVGIPVTTEGEPDFQYMENYIKEIEQKYISNLKQKLEIDKTNLLKEIGKSEEDIEEVLKTGFNESSEFKEFRTDELFSIMPTTSYKEYKDDIIMREEGTTPFITTTISNNGVRGYSKLKPNNEGNVITASDTTTSESTFYQDKDFIGRSHVQKIEPRFRGFNRNIAMYIITVFRVSALGKYDYGNKFNRKRMGGTVLKLPVTSEGEPDFGYMERYISYIELAHTNTILSRLNERE